MKDFSPRTNDTEALVKAFQAGDTAAFETLYYRYRESVSGVIFSITGDRERTEEILQETLLRAWNRSGEFRIEKGRFFTWLVNLAREAAFESLKTKPLIPQGKNLSKDIFVDITDGQADPDQKTGKDGTSGLMRRLSGKYRIVIDALYFKGYSQRDASKILGVPMDKVKTRNRNGIKQLRRFFELKKWEVMST